MAKNIIKTFAKNDAFGLFSKAVKAGGAVNVNEKMLTGYFDDFLTNNSDFLLESDVIQDLGDGVKKIIRTGEDYDWNKVITSIGSDFGYDLSKATKLDGVVLEGDSYGRGYSKYVRNTSHNNRASVRKGKLEKLRKVKPEVPYDVDSDIANFFDNDVPMITTSNKSKLNTRTLDDINSEWRNIKVETREAAINYRKQQQGDIIKQVYRNFGPFKKKIGKIDADARGSIGHLRARELEENPELRKALGILNEMDIMNAGKNGINNAVHDTGMASKVINDGTGKDGIGLWGKAWNTAKNHPVITTAGVLGTAWGISELTEDDSL